MRKIIMAAAVVITAYLPAQAMPMQQDLQGTVARPDVTLVAAGCGIGFVRGPLGVCRRVGVAVGGYGYRGYRYGAYRVGYGRGRAYGRGYGRGFGHGYARGFARGRR